MEFEIDKNSPEAVLIDETISTCMKYTQQIGAVDTIAYMISTLVMAAYKSASSMSEAEQFFRDVINDTKKNYLESEKQDEWELK